MPKDDRMRGHDNGANANGCADVAGAQRRRRRVLNTYDMLYSGRSNEFCDVTAKPARDPFGRMSRPESKKAPEALEKARDGLGNGTAF